MAGRKPVKWSVRARKEWREILIFYRKRNGNSEYGRKLQKQVDAILTYVKQDEEYGQATEIPNVRSITFAPFELCYKITADKIIVVTIWDARRNPEDLKI